MEVLFHLVFVIIKISILSSIYSVFVLYTFKIIVLLKPDSWFQRVSKKKLCLWIISWLFISVGLFIYMFTYFGDHGLGDNARIPIGHFRDVNQIKGIDTYLQNSKGDQLGIKKFSFDNDNLYAETQRDFNGYKGDYIVWNLRTDNWTYYNTKTDYLRIATQNNYPKPENFEEFWYYYSRHWNGWRFWLLP